MKKILFVCVENSCRSQLAEALAKFHGHGKFEIYSAGSHPSGRIHPVTVQILAEKGISLAGQFSKGLNDLPVYEWDVVVTMGCGDHCPSIRAQKKLDWNIPNPGSQDLNFFRKIRDDIEMKIKKLFEEIGKV